MKNPFDYRLRLVSHARQHGIKAAARPFQTTVPTVRKWLRRYEARSQKHVSMFGRGDEMNPESFQIVIGIRERGKFCFAPVAGARVQLADVQRAAARRTGIRPPAVPARTRGARKGE